MRDMPKGLLITLNTDEWEKQLDDNRREGRELEREAIVAWLRDEAKKLVEAMPPVYASGVAAGTLTSRATAIERGEHLGGDDVR